MPADLQALIGEASEAMPTFEWRGVTYTLRQRTGGLMALFVQWAKKHYKESLKEDRDLYTPEEWQAKIREYEERKVNGYFAWFGEYCTRLRGTQEGGLQLLRLQLGEPGKALSDGDLILMNAECDELADALSQYEALSNEVMTLAGFKKVTKIVAESTGETVPVVIDELRNELQTLSANIDSDDPVRRNTASLAAYVLTALNNAYGTTREVETWEGGDPKALARLAASKGIL